MYAIVEPIAFSIFWSLKYLNWIVVVSSLDDRVSIDIIREFRAQVSRFQCAGTEANIFVKVKNDSNSLISSCLVSIIRIISVWTYSIALVLHKEKWYVFYARECWTN